MRDDASHSDLRAPHPASIRDESLSVNGSLAVYQSPYRGIKGRKMRACSILPIDTLIASLLPLETPLLFMVVLCFLTQDTFC